MLSFTASRVYPSRMPHQPNIQSVSVSMSSGSVIRSTLSSSIPLLRLALRMMLLLYHVPGKKASAAMFFIYFFFVCIDIRRIGGIIHIIEQLLNCSESEERNESFPYVRM